MSYLRPLLLVLWLLACATPTTPDLKPRYASCLNPQYHDCMRERGDNEWCSDALAKCILGRMEE